MGNFLAVSHETHKTPPVADVNIVIIRHINAFTYGIVRYLIT